MIGLEAFVRESNLIEGIDRAPSLVEIDAHQWFLNLSKVTVGDLEQFVDVVAGAGLRLEPTMNVRVGEHLPPPGGPHIRRELVTLLDRIESGDVTPWRAHVEYESLHPFMDGNGRSGRVLWAWQMRLYGQDPFALPFLHRAYYQSLDAGRAA